MHKGGKYHTMKKEKVHNSPIAGENLPKNMISFKIYSPIPTPPILIGADMIRPFTSHVKGKYPKSALSWGVGTATPGQKLGEGNRPSLPPPRFLRQYQYSPCHSEPYYLSSQNRGFPRDRRAGTAATLKSYVVESLVNIPHAMNSSDFWWPQVIRTAWMIDSPQLFPLELILFEYIKDMLRWRWRFLMMVLTILWPWTMENTW